MGYRKRKIRELFELTADAFGCPDAPDISNRNFRDALEVYALFTSENAAAYLRACSQSPGRAGRIKELKRRLYKNAFSWGRSLRKTFRIRTRRRAELVLKIMYRTIGIDLSFSHNNFAVRRCYFAKFYSPEVCRIISALDAGLAAGISGGGRLRFTQRITESRDCCCGIFMCTGSCANEKSNCRGKRRGGSDCRPGAFRQI